jgi:DnaJ homolog subfamily C member 27
MVISCVDSQFVTKYITTIGVDYGVKKVAVAGYDVRVNFWDLSGQSDFFEIRNEFYKDAQGVSSLRSATDEFLPREVIWIFAFVQAILVYDCTSRRSFDELEQWVCEAAKYGASLIPVIVCCNKVITAALLPMDGRC